jgi:hypothetical protein
MRGSGVVCCALPPTIFGIWNKKDDEMIVATMGQPYGESPTPVFMCPQRTNRHHLVPRSRGGSNHNDNLQRRELSEHAAHHETFRNLLPHEQIAQVVTENMSVLRHRFIRQLAELLNSEPEEIYHEHAFRSKKELRRVKKRSAQLLRRLLDERNM